MKLELTARGFAHANFKDQYDANCSIQKSSLATEDCIWLGVDDEPQRHHVTQEWLGQRMHLTREMVAVLLPLLQRFVETGELGTDKDGQE